MINSLLNHNSATSQSSDSSNSIKSNSNQEKTDNNDNNVNINDTLFSGNINESNPSFNIKKSKYI